MKVIFLLWLCWEPRWVRKIRLEWDEQFKREYCRSVNLKMAEIHAGYRVYRNA
jgi:hypothetical protein